MAKTILVVSYYAPPLLNAESILVWKTLRELSSNFELKVFTSALTADTRVDPRMMLPPNVEFIRTPTFKPTNPLLRKLTDKALGLIRDEAYLWAAFGHRQTLHDTECDVIYSRSHPGASHMFAYQLKQQTGKPWIAQFSDPWTKNPYHANHTRVRKASDVRWEQRVVRHADYLVFPTKEIREMYEQVYAPFDIRSKSIVLPHHYGPELYRDGDGENEQLGMPVKVGEPPESAPPLVSFAYFGDFYGVRTPEPFIRALEHIAESNPSLLSRVKITFYGNIEGKFSNMVDNAPVTISRGKVTYFESLTLMAQNDVLLLIDAPSKTGVNPFMASKLVDYLGARKRILGITDERGTSADILRKYEHYVISPYDIEGISRAITECVTIPQNSIEPPLEFMTSHVVGELAKLMNHFDAGQE